MGHVRVSVMAAMSISSHTEEATQIQLRTVLHFSIRRLFCVFIIQLFILIIQVKIYKILTTVIEQNLYW